MYITIRHKTNNLSKCLHRTVSNNRAKALKSPTVKSNGNK